jgi:hypothetical protein
LTVTPAPDGVERTTIVPVVGAGFEDAAGFDAAAGDVLSAGTGGGETGTSADPGSAAGC